MNSLENLLAAATSATDPTEAAEALDKLCLCVLPPALGADELLDESSFDIFDAAMRHANTSHECHQSSEKLLFGLGESASATLLP